MSPIEALMKLAIEAAKKGIAAEQSPFGCAISLDGEVIAVAHNQVIAHIDSTAHAEITAIRAACQKTGNIHLKGAIVAATCEPCPMCMAALHWARVKRVYYGATIADATAAGFNELDFPAEKLMRESGSPVELVPGFMEAECRSLFEIWATLDSASY